MSVLVTGGAGYIGSHTCKALHRAGFVPVTYDNLSTGHAYAVKWGPFVQGDIADKSKLRDVIHSFKPIAVIHFAADALVIESMRNPAKYYRNNVAGTLSLLETMREENISNLIFSSTCATYGEPQFIPLTEYHPQHPVNPYGRSKLMIEQILSDFEVYGLKSIKLRYFNAAGADLNTEIGENHTPETHIIPSIIQAAFGLKDEIAIYGTDFSTRDGSAIRDYIHVHDLAEAHVLSLRYLLETQKSDVFNLGTGTGTSVLEIIDAVQKLSSTPLPVRLENRRPGEPGILTADSAKAATVLHWTPTHSDLSTLIESAWKWHRLLLDNSAILRNTMQRLENAIK